MPSKLHLKETPSEHAERELRKIRKAAKKRRREQSDSSSDEADEPGPSNKRLHSNYSGHAHQAGKDCPYVFVDDEDECGPPPPPPPPPPASSRARKPDYDRIRAELEEERFREKMFGAMEEDERLDALESRLNDYAHVPRRWRGGGMDRIDDELDIDPSMMEEEDYAEWVRAGMWRRKHAAEYEEHERKKAARAARKSREKAIRDETKRMERQEEQNRTQRRMNRERRRAAQARELYDLCWKDLLAPSSDAVLHFSDLPWPIHRPDLSSRRKRELTTEDLTVDAISAFLVTQDDSEAGKKERKEKLRETMLRFHPDKFEGRILKHIVEAEQERVREGVGIVVRAVSGLMGESK